MMRILLTTLILALGFGMAMAQSSGTPEEKANYLTDVLMNPDLEMSAEQLEKAKAANLEMFRKIAKEEASGGSLRTIRGFMVERNKQLSGILSADQMKTFESKMREYQMKVDKKFGHG